MLDSTSITAFCIFASVNALAAIYAPILDCDEVFNYWEPTHYLNYGFGLQTWEYSPEYAIRSWLYILLHVIPGQLGDFFMKQKYYGFYLTRIMLACVCAGAETRLFSAISRSLDPTMAKLFLMAMTTTPGVFYASVAYLPSSFAMYTSMTGLAAFIDVQPKLQTRSVVVWFGIGALVGWPFAAALVLPLFIDELSQIWETQSVRGTIHRFLDGGLTTLLIVVKKLDQISDSDEQLMYAAYPSDYRLSLLPQIAVRAWANCIVQCLQ